MAQWPNALTTSTNVLSPWRDTLRGAYPTCGTRLLMDLMTVATRFDTVMEA